MSTVNEILDFAIEQEEQAAQFYTDLAGKVDKAWMKDIFTGFAKEEMGHKAKLLGVKEGKMLISAETKVADLKIAEYLVDAQPTADIDYQDALILAMKKEKAAFKLYSDIAAASDDETVKNTFLALAQEEAKHKLRFEVEYDQFVLTDN